MDGEDGGTMPPEGSRATPGAVFGLALALLLPSLIYTGMDLLIWNSRFQMPLVFRLADPSLYPGDRFVATLPRYTSILWPAVAWLAARLPLGGLVLMLFALERLLVLCAAGFLARAMAQRRPLAAVLVMVAFALRGPRPVVGAGTIVATYFEQTGLAIGLLLLAMAAFHRQARYAWAVALGLALAVNCLYGVYAGLFFAAAFASEADYRREWRRWLVPVLICVAMALPELLGASRNATAAGQDPRLWTQCILSLLPFHMALDSQPESGLMRLVLLLGLVATARPCLAVLAPRLRTHLTAWTVAACAMVAMSVVAERLAVPALVVMHWLRGTDVWLCYVTVALLVVGAERTAEVRWPCLVAAGPAAVLLCGAPAPAAATWVTWLAARWDRRRVLVATLVGTGCVVLLACQTAATERPHGASLPASRLRRPAAEVAAIGDWAQAHTAVDDQFLIDPVDERFAMFRAVAKRGVFLLWQDGYAALWDQAFLSEWLRRMAAMDIDVPSLIALVRAAGGNWGKVNAKLRGRLAEHYSMQLRTADARALASTYHLHYWVVPKTRRTTLPQVYATDSYAVLDLLAAPEGVLAPKAH